MTDRRVATAKRLIAKDGQSVTWKSLENGMPLDPAKPWLVSESECTEYEVEIVFLPDERFNFQGEKFYPDTEVPSGFELGLMASQDFTPKIKDVIVANGVEKVVRNIRTLAPNGTPILYTMELGV